MVVDIAAQDRIDRLIASRQFGEAADLLRKIVDEQPRNVRMRERLADVLTLAGQKRKAVKVLDSLVDDFVRAGLPARAIAVVKKMQRIDPGFRDLDAKLAVLVKRQQAIEKEAKAAKRMPKKPSKFDASRTTEKIRRPPKPNTPAASRANAPVAEPPRRFEQPVAPPEDPFVSKIDIPKDPLSVPAKPVKPVEPVQAAPPPPPPAASPPAFTYDDLILQNEVEELDVLNPRDDGADVTGIRGSALFSDFDTDELQALISGLEHLQVQPGEIIVAEGQPGSSLYLIAKGSVRVYVVNPDGVQKQIRVLSQGDFFGEISLLKGTKRTATITAATEVELLELDREAVDRMAEKHPNVRQVIELFCSRRAGSAEELDVRAGR